MVSVDCQGVKHCTSLRVKLRSEARIELLRENGWPIAPLSIESE